MARWIGLALFIYAVVVLFAVVRGRSMIFLPTSLTQDNLRLLARAGWSNVQRRAADGVELVGLLRRPADPATARWMIFFGGNAFSLAGSQQALEEVLAHAPDAGAVVFAYRGYDGSGGSPAERTLVEDGSETIAWLHEAEGVSPDRAVLAGQSIGSGIAVQVAARLSRAGTPPRAVALLSPYTSVSRLANQIAHIPIGWALPDRFDSARVFAEIRAPILIVHGT